MRCRTGEGRRARDERKASCDANGGALEPSTVSSRNDSDRDDSDRAYRSWSVLKCVKRDDHILIISEWLETTMRADAG